MVLSDSALAAPPLVDDDTQLVRLLRAGDEPAFIDLIERYHAPMLQLARLYVRDYAVAQEVVQDAWLGVLRGVERFQARSSLKTWIFHIVVNIARTRATREQRSVPLSALDDTIADPFEPSVEPERFVPADALRGAGQWVSCPPSRGDAPEERLLARETRSQLRAAIELLPASQRQVVVLRDVEGWSSEEVCTVLRISETNQRVLLHRGRSRLRRALERYLTAT